MIITSGYALDSKEGLLFIIPTEGRGTQTFARAMFVTLWIWKLLPSIEFETLFLLQVITQHVRGIMMTVYLQAHTTAGAAKPPSIHTIAKYYSDNNIPIPHATIILQAFAMASGLARTFPKTIVLTPAGTDPVLEEYRHKMHREKLEDQTKRLPTLSRRPGDDGESERPPTPPMGAGNKKEEDGTTEEDEYSAGTKVMVKLGKYHHKGTVTARQVDAMDHAMITFSVRVEGRKDLVTVQREDMGLTAPTPPTKPPRRSTRTPAEKPTCWETDLLGNRPAGKPTYWETDLLGNRPMGNIVVFVSPAGKRT